MANLTASLRLSGDKQYAFSSTKSYDQVFNLEQELDIAEAFIQLVAFSAASTTKAAQTLADAKFVCINNPSPQVIEVRMVSQGITAGATDLTGGTDANLSFILRPNEYFVLPSTMMINYTTAASAMYGTDLSLDNAVPNANAYEDTGTSINAGEGGTHVIGSASATNLWLPEGDWTDVANGPHLLFKTGDLIMVNSEVMEIVAVGSGEDGTNNNYLTVKRGLYGTTAASDHTADDAIRLPFFNAFDDTITTVKTDLSGNYKAMNFMGKGRQTLATKLDGFCRGTLAIKFYTEGGYQEFGMSNVTANTNSGLVAGQEYKFNITVDGGSLHDNLAFTVDASNLNFGGTNGIIDKINTALRTQYYTAGNLFEKSISCSIVNGDIRFVSNSNNSSTAILLAAPTSGTTPFGVGRIPAIGNIEDAVASRLPEDTITVNGISTPNTGAFLLDDGFGRLTRGAGGVAIFDYDSGAITMSQCPPDAEFVVTAIGGSGLACGGNSNLNQITSISARSVNPKRNASVQILAFD